MTQKANGGASSGFTRIACEISVIFEDAGAFSEGIRVVVHIGSLELSAGQFYFSFGLLCLILEVFAPGFVLFPIGVALMLTAGVTLLTDELAFQLVGLGLNLTIVFWATRRWIHPRFRASHFSTNADSRIGKEAVVEEAIEPAQRKGYVRLFGDSWQATTEDGSNLPAGASVVITKVDGNRVTVKPKRSFE